MQRASALESRPLQRPAWLTREVWPFDSRMAQVDGVAVHFMDVGSGPALVFVHTGFWSLVWRDVIVLLRDSFRCVAIDFPSSGLSGRANGRPTFDGHSRTLEALVDGLAIERCTLVCHDLGSIAGLSLAARAPQLAERIVAVNSFGWPPEQRGLRAMLRMMGSPPVRELNAATNFVGRMAATKFGVGMHFDRATRRAFRQPLRKRHQRRAFHHLMRDATRAGVLDGIESTLQGELHDRPVLTIFGERNDPFRFQPRWLELFPGAEQVVVPRGNHFPMCDDPQLVARAIRDWHARSALL